MFRRLLVTIAVLAVCAPSYAASKVIIYMCGAKTLREVFAENRPTLQELVRDGGAAVLTTGPDDTVFLSSLLEGAYTREWNTYSADRLLIDDLVVIPADMPYQSPVENDRIFAKTLRQFPDLPVIAIGSVREPSEPDERIRNRYPTWIAVSNMQGRLTSDTTRTPGVVSNLDVAPTVWALATGEAPRGTPGHVIRSGTTERLHHSVPKSIAATMRLQNALAVIGRETNRTNYTIAFGAILLFTAGTALCGLTGRGKAKRFVQRALLVSFAAPIGVAISAWRQPDTPAVFHALSIVVTLGLIAAFILLGEMAAHRKEHITLTIIELALGGLCAFIFADIARHGLPLKLSPLSNFYQTGIRYYGLGNEYAALFIAAEVLVALIALQLAGGTRPGVGTLVFLGFWYTGCAGFAGWHTLGANFGGMVAAFATGGIAWALLARGSVRLSWLWPAVVAIVSVGFVVWFDACSSNATHIGAFAGALSHGGGKSILITKLAMNTRLLVQPAAWVLYALTALLCWLWLKPLRHVLYHLGASFPCLVPGFIAVVLGGIVAMLVNDTGIVMLGLMAGTGAGVAMMLALEPRSYRMATETVEAVQP